MMSSQTVGYLNSLPKPSCLACVCLSWKPCNTPLSTTLNRSILCTYRGGGVASECALAFDKDAARLQLVDLDADLVLFIFGGRSVEGHPQTLLGASAVMICLLDHYPEHVVGRRQQRPLQHL